MFCQEFLVVYHTKIFQNEMKKNYFNQLKIFSIWKELKIYVHLHISYN